MIKRTINGGARYPENPNPADSHLFKVDNQNTRIIWEVCLKLTIKTPEQSHVFTLNFE